MKAKSKEYMLKKLQKDRTFVEKFDVFMGLFVTISLAIAFMTNKSILGVLSAICVYSVVFTYTIRVLEMDIKQCENEIEKEKELK